MRLTRLGRATAIGILVSGAFALGREWAEPDEAPLVNGESERAPTLAFTIPGSRVQVVDLTGTAELGPLWEANGFTVRWAGGEGPLTIGPVWGDRARTGGLQLSTTIAWTLGRSLEQTEVGEFEAITVVLDEGPVPRVVRQAPASF